MVKLVKVDKPLFVVRSVLGKKIRTHQNYWDKIQEIKHPEAKLSLEQIKEAVKDSTIVYKSKQGKNVYLYTKEFKNYKLIVVVKHLDGDGFILTSYKTDRPIRKDIVWQR